MASRVLDLCTGSGCLAILLASELGPDIEVVASDISSDALAVAARNVADYGFDDGTISLHQADLFDGLPPGGFDLIVANPPYVTDDAVANFPPEYAAEPRIAHAGGTDGLVLVSKILSAARAYLNEGGMLIVEIGQARGALELAFPTLPFLWHDTALSGAEVFSLRQQDLPA